jgi:hypothetical protein
VASVVYAVPVSVFHGWPEGEMLEIIPFEENNIIGLRLEGSIDEGGLELAFDEFRKVLEGNDKVRVYVEVADVGWESIETFFRNMRMKLELLGEIGKFEREAVVSDKGWLEIATRIGDVLLPGIDVRHFPVAEKASAMAWIRGA